VGLEARFGERTGARTCAFEPRFDDSSLNRHASAYGRAELELCRTLNCHTRLSLAYRHWRNGGEGAVADFRQNRVLLQLACRR
jgi:hypothetical protein